MQLLKVSNNPVWADDSTRAYAVGCFIGHIDGFSDARSASVDSG